MLQPARHRNLARFFLLMAATVLFGAPVSAQETPIDPIDGFQQYLDQLLADFQVPGAAVAVVGVDPGPRVFVSGMTETGGNRPITPDTSFHIASMTKAFTATTAAVLVDEGVVEWDTPVREVIPEFELMDPLATRNSTLRDCLAHRTGIGRSSIQGFNLAEDPSWWLPRLRHLAPEGEFRDRGIYSGVMVTVAGLMLERASETPWEQLVATRLFEPLGMTRTTAGPPRDDKASIARPHLVIDEAAVEIEVIASTPDMFQSGLWSSADDMIRWMEFLLDGGRHGDRALVSPESFSEMWTPQIVIRRGYNPRRTALDAYGFGWRIGTLHDTLELSHGGGGAGYTSHILLVPARGLGITVLTNTALNPVPDLAGNWLLNRVFEIDAPDPREGAKRMVAQMAESQRAAHLQALEERDSSLPPPLPLAAYTGTYSDFVYGDVEVGTDETGLTFAYHGVQTDVDHLHGNVFLFSSPLFDDLRSEFQVSPEGEVAAVKVPIGHNGALVVFRRQPADQGPVKDNANGRSRRL